MYCLRAGWCFSFCHFTFIVAHACTSFLSLLLYSSLCCAFLIRRHATSVLFLNLLCFDGIVTSFYLCALIECVRQSVTLNLLFGQIQEVLIHLSESNKVNLTVLVLFVSCLFARSRVVYTQANCKIIHIQCNMLEVHSLWTEFWEWCCFG